MSDGLHLKRCKSTFCTEQPVGEFYKKADSKDGYTSKCKTCIRLRSKKWRDANLERANKVHAEWYAANGEIAKASRVRWAKANPEKVREAVRKWNDSNPDVLLRIGRRWEKANKLQRQVSGRAFKLKKYNLTPSQYDALLDAQDGRCAICGSDSPGRGHAHFSVDHCHKSGRVRGLLCGNCNVGIGLLGDCAERVTAAVRYLEGVKL